MIESIPGTQTFQKRPSGGHKKPSRNFKVFKKNHDNCTQSTWEDKERELLSLNQSGVEREFQPSKQYRLRLCHKTTTTK